MNPKDRTRIRRFTLPQRFLKEPLAEDNPSAGAVLHLEPMLEEYYRARGWDVETGLPMGEKLAELGLVDTADV